MRRFVLLAVIGTGHFGRQPLPGAASPVHRPRLQRRAVSHAPEPAPDEFSGPNRGRLAHQHEEGRLNGVLGIGPVAQDSPANAENHWAVPAEQAPEGRLIVARQEGLQQVRVRRSIPAVEEGSAAKVPQDGFHCFAPCPAVPDYRCIAHGVAARW